MEAAMNSEHLILALLGIVNAGCLILLAWLVRDMRRDVLHMKELLERIKGVLLLRLPPPPR
jgi:hypothetical protein